MRVLCALLVTLGSAAVVFGAAEEVSGLPVERLGVQVPTRCPAAAGWGSGDLLFLTLPRAHFSGEPRARCLGLE